MKGHRHAIRPQATVASCVSRVRLGRRLPRFAHRLAFLLAVFLAVLAATSCASSDGGGIEGNDGAASGSGGGAAGAGVTGSGGTVGTGGAIAGSGGANTGGSHLSGSAGASGGTSATGGSAATGGASASGGTGATGGAAATGGAGASAGTGATGGSAAIGGASGSGGMPAGGRGGTGGGAAAGAGGETSSGGRGGGSGGRAGTGGTAGGGGASGGAGTDGTAGAAGGTGPCDIYQAANTPCVAAHSTVRALYSSYAANLYQLRRASDKTVKDVPVLAPGGYVNISVHDAFCSGTTCTISIIYDQSPNKNDLAKSPVAYWLKNGGNEANAADGKAMVAGHVVHGIYVTGYSSNVAYRNNATKGVPKGDQAEAMYMVVDGKRFSNQCCFDYGNAETSGKDDGNGTMEAVYWGNDITWGGKGEGNGPWVAADLENGVFKSDKGGWQSQSLSVPNAKSVIATYATAMLKGPSGNHFTLKAGNAQSGTLTKMWDGVRPSPGYSPKKLQGAIILGTGGDGSNGGTGTFFEGAMTLGTPPDATDDLIQANIVAAGYGH